jgi:hypothetical protein
MESTLAGEACAQPGRTWASRKAIRAESKREQQFYRFARPSIDTSCIVLIFSKLLWPFQTNVRQRSNLLRRARTASTRAAQTGVMPGQNSNSILPIGGASYEGTPLLDIFLRRLARLCHGRGDENTLSGR